VPAAVTLPSHEEPFVRGVSTLIGGRVGRHARIGGRRWLWTPLRVLIALTILSCTLGWAAKAQCRDVRTWSHNGGVYQYTRLCYSDVVALYSSDGLADGEVPYLDHPVEYPVLIGATMDLARVVAHLADDDGKGKSHIHSSALFYDATVFLLSLGALVTVVCTGLTAGRRRLWDAALVALAPTLILHLATNWDMVAVALASAGLLAWARRRPMLAGVLIGLATAAKLYPLLFLVPLFALCLRAGRLRAWGRALAGTVVGFLAVTLPVYLVSPSYADCPDGGAECTAVRTGPSAWQVLTGHGHGTSLWSALSPWHDHGSNAVMRFFQGNVRRGSDWDSLWLLLEHIRRGSVSDTKPLDSPRSGSPGPGGHLWQIPSHLNLAWEAAALVLLAGVLVLIFLAPRRPRLPQVLFLTTVAFLLASKVFSPQYTLWLLPLWALARPRWREFLVWQGAEILVVITRYMYFVHLQKSSTGVGYEWFAGCVLFRDFVLVWLCALIVRDVLHPGRDPVRADGADDDPAGGVLDGVPDRHDWARPDLESLPPVGDPRQPSAPPVPV
jgi:uncharacterized membrane protein